MWDIANVVKNLDFIFKAEKLLEDSGQGVTSALMRILRDHWDCSVHTTPWQQKEHFDFPGVQARDEDDLKEEGFGICFGDELKKIC